MKVGERVGAVSHSDNVTVYLFGYGVYDGDVIPPQELKVQFLGSPLALPNPQITLDSGKRVYGCECWWGSEEQVKKHIGNRPVVLVDIEEERRKASGENG